MDVFSQFSGMFFKHFVICSSILIPHNTMLSSPGVEVTYIIVVFAVIFTLAVGGLAISLYIRYSL